MEQFAQWLQSNANTVANIIQSVAILITLYYTYAQLKRTDQTNRSVYSLEITTSHREIWKLMFENPQLSRILEPKPDLENQPITPQERLFVLFVTNHLLSVFQAKIQNLFKIQNNFQSDMVTFFLLPIPNRVWQDIKKYQVPEFVIFIDALLENKNPIT